MCERVNCLLVQPIVMHLACVLLHLSMPEALVAATLNAAASLGKADTHGSLEVGKLADMVVIDAPRYSLLNAVVSCAITACNSCEIVGPIPWGHSGPLCHALSLWTSMRKRHATVLLATPGEWA